MNIGLYGIVYLENSGNILSNCCPYLCNYFLRPVFSSKLYNWVYFLDEIAFL
jgi:hypothetical protein